VNFVRDVVAAREPAERAMVELGRDGSRREWSFGEVVERSEALAATIAARGVGRGDVVLTLIGNRPEWVLSLLACWRIGAVALPCIEQLREKDLRARLDAARPALVIADARNRSELEAAMRGREGTGVLLFPTTSSSPPAPSRSPSWRRPSPP
jgi:acyl-coenzyme A synthetase/AMP-(fatty) acid ligase